MRHRQSDQSHRTLSPDGGARTSQAGSSFAYLASSFFTPTAVNRTVTFKSSLCSSTAMTVPTPNCAWRTRMPVRSAGRRLILVLVGVGRRRLPVHRRRGPCRAVRVRAELVVAVANALWYARAYAGAIRSTSSAGISSRNRDGSVDWYSPNTRRRAALGQHQPFDCARVMPT